MERGAGQICDARERGLVLREQSRSSEHVVVAERALISIEGGWIDLSTSEVRRGEEVYGLTPIERRLLQHLWEREGQVVSREQLLVEVWGYRPGVHTRTIDSTVRRLRKKVERDPSNPGHIESIYGQGLRFRAASPASGPPQASLPPSDFVGREHELAVLTGSLLSGVRLVSVVGPPGAGKSRLIEQVLDTIGVGERVWVAAQGLSGVPEVEQALCRRLGARDDESLVDVLARCGEVRVVLDGVEALVEALRPRVQAWLEAAPELQVVVASRRVLGLPGEQQLPVEGLDAEAAQRLFEATLRRQHPLRPPMDTTACARLVQAVDGLPLAIELVASTLDTLPMLGLGDAVAAAVSSSVSVGEVVDSSLRLLSGSARRALVELCVFQAAASTDAVQQVLGERLDEIYTLQDHGLVRLREGDDGVRFEPYAIVRARLLATDQPSEAIRREHAGWATRSEEAEDIELSAALAWARRVDPELAASCGIALLKRLHGTRVRLDLIEQLRGLACSGPARALLTFEEARVRQVEGQWELCEQLLDRVIPELATDSEERVGAYAIRIACAMRSGRFEEADQLTDAALAETVGAPPEHRAELFLRKAALCVDFSQDPSEHLAQVSQLRTTEGGLRPGWEAWCLQTQSDWHEFQGRWAEALEVRRGCVAAIERAPEEVRGRITFRLGLAVFEGFLGLFDAAQHDAEIARALAAGHGFVGLQGHACFVLASFLMRQGELDEAERCLALASRHTFFAQGSGRSELLGERSLLHHLQGPEAAALRALEAALAADAITDSWTLGWSAWCVAQLGELDTARALLEPQDDHQDPESIRLLAIEAAVECQHGDRVRGAQLLSELEPWLPQVQPVSDIARFAHAARTGEPPFAQIQRRSEGSGSSH